MNNDITTEERIDNYLLGRMSDSEKIVFERDMASDAELKEEFECQKVIANAVQKLAMKNFLVKHAEQRQAKRSNVIRLYRKRMAWALASVAAVVIAIVGGVNYTSALHTIQRNGTLAYAELVVPVVRDGNELDNMIEEAHKLIGSGELNHALEVIGNAKSKVNECLALPDETEEEAYKHQVLQLKMYDLDWYEAIVLMKQRKLIKAKRALKAIAKSASPYADNARIELNNIF